MSSSGALSTASRATSCLFAACTGTTAGGSGAASGSAAAGTAAILLRCAQVELGTLNLGPFRPLGLSPSLLGSVFASRGTEPNSFGTIHNGSRCIRGRPLDLSWVARYRTQYPYIERTCDYGCRRRMYADTS